ncbi:egg cell-secreted protein 1.2-like [Oryza brachyantha]|uniref:egg cell-secreted protein 1.2-like n=1 Tax=Oryza brachyantha TaxID=4533 RepID=UPI001ADD1119|nr:egg cell-secreted protein 1.2-like [Oryza brachyantha]
MARTVKLVVIVGALLAGVALVAAGRVAGATAAPAEAAPPPPLVKRLHASFDWMDAAAAAAAEGGDGGGGGGWMMECWNAVTELRSCTGEIVLFFVNGESYLGPECCVAIRTVTRHCWPAMLASVGFTAQEADILRGFCDAEVGAGDAPPPSANASSVVPASAPAPA